VLGVGIDWAEEFHVVALGRSGEGVVEVLRIEHRPGAVSALAERIARLEADPAEVRVVIETRHGLLVEALVDAGYTVLPVNPELVSRRRGPARKKDDAEDARICCLFALDRHAGLKRLIPHGQIGGELRSIARDDERACRDERRLLNRLRADLIATFPAALAIAGEDLGAPRVLRLLQRWPTAQVLAATSREEIIEFARAQRTGYLQRFADRVQAALGSDQFVAPAHLVRAKADTIRLTAAQLLLIDAQRRVWEKRMGHLLLGVGGQPAENQPTEDQPGQPFPGGEIYLSFPGLGRRLAARIAGEIGEHVEQFSTPNSLQCYAGRAPVTRRSGKRDFVVAHRLACNRYLADAVHEWAFASLRRCAWAKQFYDAQRMRNKNHHAALRALGNRWLEVLWDCLIKGVRYNDAVHVANRNRALGTAGSQQQPDPSHPERSSCRESATRVPCNLELNRQQPPGISLQAANLE
jgi:transposase